MGPSWASLGCSWGSLGSNFGPPDRPKWAETLWPLRSLGSLGSIFGLFFSILAAEDCLKIVLEPSWAPSWWSRGLLGALLVPAKPILSSKIDLPSLDDLVLSSLCLLVAGSPLRTSLFSLLSSPCSLVPLLSYLFPLLFCVSSLRPLGQI